ncbi:MAG: M42 family metallopeptidase [Oscillospiraceae bacterium]|nr:M42 family metallopeptidase [Oscillospiraceae bacterium]
MDFNLLERLCLANGVSGFENEVRGIILEEIKDCVDDVNVDIMGNISAFKKGRNTSKIRLLLSAHMDEVGFIINHITNDGFLKFSSIGSTLVLVLLGKKVSIGKNKIPGIIGLKPIHLSGESERKNIPNLDELFIDIGVSSKKEAEKYVKVGDYAVFNSIFYRQNSSIISKALDDRAGCAILIDLIKKDLEFDLYFSFVVQEEIGLRGAKTATYALKPDAAIVVESTTACDILGIESEKRICILGDGPVLAYADKMTIYDKKYVNSALNLAQSNGVKAQLKRFVSGANDCGEIHVSRSGVRSVSLSLPCRYLHSAFSVVNVNDIRATEDLLDLLYKDILA